MFWYSTLDPRLNPTPSGRKYQKELSGYDDEDLEDGFSESDYEVDEVFESLIEDLTDEQLEELNRRLTDHISR